MAYLMEKYYTSTPSALLTICSGAADNLKLIEFSGGTAADTRIVAALQ